jgi:hypothetical protein
MKYKRIGYNIRLKAKIDARTRGIGPKVEVDARPQEKLLDEGYYYWNSGTKLFVCAVALVDVVLEKSLKARSDYFNILEAWKLPGCQHLMPEFTTYGSIEKTFRDKLLIASITGEVPSDWPESWKMTYEKSKANMDWQILLGRVYQLIPANFNLKLDLENERPMVIPDNAPNLISAIVCRSIARENKITCAEFGTSGTLLG